MTKNGEFVLEPVPKEVVTLIRPFVAPEGTRAVICVPPELTLTLLLVVPLNFTTGRVVGGLLVKWTPLMMIASFTPPNPGEKSEM